MKRSLIIFAKEPRIGAVKTRLASYLTQAGCLALYKKLLRNTVAFARSVKCGRKIIAYDSRGKHPAFLKKTAPDFEFYEQKGKDLGERMFDAFSAVITENTKAVIIGSDSPGLPGNCVSRAFEELTMNDVVLGPAHDGGYYLIGLKKPCKSIFEGVKWSSREVFEKTYIKAKKLKKKVTVLGLWYDIDTPEDLQYLRKKRGLR